MILDQNILEKAMDNKITEKIYDDLLSVPLKETSKLITYFIKTAQCCLAPLQYVATYQEKLEKRLEASIKQIPEENRICPPNSILIPIINNLSYLEDGILADLFQSLLSKAMDKTRNSVAHPAFIVTINQLSPDEAIILYELKFTKFKFIRSADLDIKQNKFYNQKMIKNEFPINKLLFHDNFEMYLGHLEKLDLICVSDKDSEPTFNTAGGIVTEQKGITETYTMGLTQFGELFAKACLPDE